MTLTFTAKQRARMVETLEQDFEDADQAATAVLATAMELLAERAKFTVVGQIKHLDSDPDDKPRDKIALGYYATAKQALDDALKLTYSTQTHEEHLAWVLPVHHGTPASYYAKRKKEKQLAEAGDKSARVRELDRRAAWFEEHPGEPAPKDWGLVPFDSEFEDCFMCEGTGKLRKFDPPKEG